MSFVIVSSDTTVNCNHGMIKCASSNVCIPRQWQCNGRADCEDNSDEQACDSTECSSNEFECADGKCIDLAWRCDLDHDCDDASDEVNCSTSKYLISNYLQMFMAFSNRPSWLEYSPCSSIQVSFINFPSRYLHTFAKNYPAHIVSDQL